jgi:hypothetical protein
VRRLATRSAASASQARAEPSAFDARTTDYRCGAAPE